ncbi:transglycosylase SLT domain-containing protein [uncultured Alsobacter sp.]|uniref:transglycosylase SLT domain-containing protein n=1 Tax=uncultured Alsobacter sp. TaxID=1748258 RepID=UPI0025DB759B|nr:transglycosylase SLT domain-containing protein [uncultured Alsobacter sp.]
MGVARLAQRLALAVLLCASAPARAAFEGLVTAGPAPVQASDAAADAICLLVEAAAVGNGLPITFFSRLIGQESSFRPQAQGPMTRFGVRAQGIAQFMPGTAAERGLTDPFDPVQALPRAAEFLRDLKAAFGNWGLAAAAYNAGPRRIEGVIGGDAFLPAETAAYVFEITGHTVQDWIAARKAGTDLPMPNDSSCAQVRASLRAPGASPFLTALERRVEAGLAKPWGVQLSAGFSRARALAAYGRAERQFSGILAGRDPMILRTVLRSRGTRGFYQVRAGTSSRAEAEALCNSLRKAGGACLVLASSRKPAGRAKRG